MKDQLDRLLKKLNFTRETVKEIKNIMIHGINQGGSYRKQWRNSYINSWLKPFFTFNKGHNGKIYIMYYDADLQYYFVFETCRYRIWYHVGKYSGKPHVFKRYSIFKGMSFIVNLLVNFACLVLEFALFEASEGITRAKKTCSVPFL